MPYIFTLPDKKSFKGVGLEGYTFGPLIQQDLDIYYVESTKGHDTFMVSKKITRTYYILSGDGYFTIDDTRYDVKSGLLVEVPPNVEYCYSGRMTLLVFARPRWFNGNDRHTRWNQHAASGDQGELPNHESRLTRLVRFVKGGGKTNKLEGAPKSGEGTHGAGN